MSDELLSRIDAAVNAAQESECACGCGRTLTAKSDSFYYAGPDCQKSWYLQEQALAAGDTERVDELRDQRSEDPIARLRRRTMELGPSDEERAERHWCRLGVAAWLATNGIDPAHVVDGQPIVTTPTSIVVHDFIRDEEGRPRFVAGAMNTFEVTYPLMVSWPAGLLWEHHRHEPDEEALDDRRPEDLLTSVAGAASLLSHGEQVDATDLLGNDPLAYRVRCLGCGLRGTPLDAEVRPEQDGLEWRHWVSDCGTYMSTSDVTATVERFSQADGLHLRLGYGRELVHYVLPEHLLDRYDSLDPIWREMEQLVATSVRLPWSDPRSNPLRDVREHADQAYQRGAATVSVASVDTPPSWDGWVDLGWTTDDGLRAEEEVVVGFDGAGPDATLAIARSYHTPGGKRVTAIDVSVPPHEQFARRWMETVLHFRLGAEQAGVAMRLFGAAVGRAVEQLSPLLRAIEAKKNQAHGPQRKKRAPRRIDPRRGR